MFVSYRREDTISEANQIHWLLRSRFGPNSVFLDMESIPFGIDFREKLSQAIDACDVVLALIGVDWLRPDQHGARRLDNPDDYVRMELALALQRGKPIIPVLVNLATMPRPDDLPADLEQLAYQNAARLDYRRRVDDDLERIVRDIEYLAREGNSRTDTNSSLRIVSSERVDGGPFPVWNFTLVNRSSMSQVITELRGKVIEYRPSAGIPQTRVLEPLAVWDVLLPYGTGEWSHTPPHPVLISPDDAATISLRFHCAYGDAWISPGEAAFYEIRVSFLTDLGLVAASSPFSF